MAAIQTADEGERVAEAAAIQATVAAVQAFEAAIQALEAFERVENLMAVEDPESSIAAYHNSLQRIDQANICSHRSFEASLHARIASYEAGTSAAMAYRAARLAFISGFIASSAAMVASSNIVT